jgi:hypothetical protein
MTQVRNEWSKLQEDWSIALVLARGPSDYYSYAPRKLRDEIREFAESVTREADSDERRAIELGYAAHVRAVTTFLDLCAGLVLQGRLRSVDVYSILGPDITRHGAAIRWMSGLREPIWRFDPTPEARGGYSWLSHLTISAFHAEQERILSLIDLLWAQSAKSGDHYPHVLMRCARLKRRSTGRVCRRRIRRLARLYGNHRLALRLQVELLASEYLRSEAFYQQGTGFILSELDWKCVRLGIWRLRALTSFLNGYRFIPPAMLLHRRRLGIYLRRFHRTKPLAEAASRYLARRRSKHRNQSHDEGVGSNPAEPRG